MRPLHRQPRANGFTLLELMISAAILVVTLVALLATYISLAALIESSRNTTTAINDANRVIEQMRNSAATSFLTMTSSNWTSWAAANGAGTLTSEQVAFSFNCTSCDLTMATVNVSWSERNRTRSEVVTTLIANRQ